LDSTALEVAKPGGGHTVILGALLCPTYPSVRLWAVELCASRSSPAGPKQRGTVIPTEISKFQVSDLKHFNHV